ncbi:hypothetical protein IRT45_34390 [Nocardia sp. BSTN01]|uniref:hypothetical protein n=1 Tax=Nocardia sp. BSTN01 TaxID=2783665 RepID=UPI00188FE441|nr:hypothetical protein [Nocardia sp. BSTN01]MBF5002209.1 hypothetical protein [Nocardia sp. BSTN01]
MSTALSPRISRLRQLIDHPATGAAERDAAQRMLDRILAKHPQAVGPRGDRDYGPRYHRVGRHATLASIAEMISQDIAFAKIFSMPQHRAELAERSPIRDAPIEISYSVATPYVGKIIVTIEGVPREWGWVSDCGIDNPSPALQELVDELAEIMNAYNHDGSDIGKRFFACVRVPERTLIW